MELIQRFLGFFSTTDHASQAILIFGAMVGVLSALKTLLALIAPMTGTKVDDKMLGFITVIYDFLAKITDHGGKK